VRSGGRRACITWADRHGRAVHVDAAGRQGPQRPDPRRGDQVGPHRAGPRLDVGIHLDEAACDRRDGPCDGVDDTADPAARWRSRRSRRGLRQLGEGAWAAVSARPHRRPHPSLPGRRRCQLRGRDRRLDGEGWGERSDGRDVSMHSKYYIAARSATPPYTVDVTPESAGWTEASLKVVELASMQELTLGTGDTEVMILPLAGQGTVEADNEGFELSSRASVFDGPADIVYIGTGQNYMLCGEGRFAICGASAKRQLPNRRVAAADVPVELRGTGNCSRQVHNFGTAGVFEADSLIACEVITPGGNWSSYPAHKHDENTPVESALEEIYYFEIDSGPDNSRGFGYHRVYGTPDRPIEVLEEVRSGDVVLVPHGYHGPSVAAPGYHMYYLNVMAGAGEERAWKIVDDPEHAWLRGTWEHQDVDPRLPLRSRGV